MPARLPAALAAALLLAASSFAVATLAAAAADNDEARYAALREQMVDLIERQFVATRHETGRAVLSKRVAEALRRVPRHAFVPAHARRFAYADSPLPIGHNQTISQPYVVALMTEVLDLEPADKVFEVGTGSGYQAAVLSELVREVYTIEIVAPLAKRARADLERLGYKNVKVRAGDGYNGWPEKAPFDAIIVTAGADQIPAPLIKQLKPGGRMVIPVGGVFSLQHLVLLEKKADGTLAKRRLLPVRFVPLTRKD